MKTNSEVIKELRLKGKTVPKLNDFEIIDENLVKMYHVPGPLANIQSMNSVDITSFPKPKIPLKSYKKAEDFDKYVSGSHHDQSLADSSMVLNQIDVSKSFEFGH